MANESIFRGTTPTLSFDMPFTYNTISVFNCTFSQGDNIVFEKALSGTTHTGNTIKIKLTQAETLQFYPSSVEIQIRVLLTGGDAWACDSISIPVKDVTKEGVLST